MSDRDKWRRLERAPERDRKLPRIRRLALSIRSLVTVSIPPEAVGAVKRRHLLAAHLCHCLARDAIRYQTDTRRVGAEHLGPPVDDPDGRDGERNGALERGIDDCDAKARLFVALARECGLDARMVPEWKGDRLAHVYAAVRLDGRELPVETTLARARLGDAPRSIPKESDGKWKHT